MKKVDDSPVKRNGSRDENGKEEKERKGVAVIHTEVNWAEEEDRVDEMGGRRSEMMLVGMWR